MRGERLFLCAACIRVQLQPFDLLTLLCSDHFVDTRDTSSCYTRCRVHHLLGFSNPRGVTNDRFQAKEFAGQQQWQRPVARKHRQRLRRKAGADMRVPRSLV